jgi:dTDP-glucose 4,6-dehydratase
MSKSILVTGGAGFIGSSFIRHVLSTYPSYHVINLDKLTYSGNLQNLADVAHDPRYEFVRGDIAEEHAVAPLVQRCDAIVNFAAESHVDRSIEAPGVFLRTNIEGVHTLLEAARKARVERFLQVSTDEVYGEVLSGASLETDALAPRSPYSASKAGAELLVRSYYVTYSLQTLVTRGSNTIGPFQYPEKVVPLFITNALDDQPLPIYGPGTALRDYMHVVDHCRGIDHVLHHGVPGEVYNVGAGNEVNTIDLSAAILAALGRPSSLVRHVKDRPGHDQRYCVSTEKIRALGWRTDYTFEEALDDTIRWYSQNTGWWKPIKQGEYARWYAEHYEIPQTVKEDA